MLSCGFLWTGLSWCPLAFRPTYLPGHPQVACCRTWPRTAAWRVAAAPQRTRGKADRCGWSSAPHAVAARGRTAQSTVRYRGITAKPPPNCLCPPPLPASTPPRAPPPTSPHSPATQRAGGQRRKLQRIVAGGLAEGGQCVGGSVMRWSALLQRTTRWRRPGPQLGVHCSWRGRFMLSGHPHPCVHKEWAGCWSNGRRGRAS